ncbi:hypothetical protein HK102_005836 [Quaeritorhiza haematococci]|nr:hypothetical protein HK102_005836 [Quaeritorhiza haematococci]
MSAQTQSNSKTEGSAVTTPKITSGLPSLPKQPPKVEMEPQPRTVIQVPVSMTGVKETARVVNIHTTQVDGIGNPKSKSVRGEGENPSQPKAASKPAPPSSSISPSQPPSQPAQGAPAVKSDPPGLAELLLADKRDNNGREPGAPKNAASANPNKSQLAQQSNPGNGTTTNGKNVGAPLTGIRPSISQSEQQHAPGPTTQASIESDGTSKVFVKNRVVGGSSNSTTESNPAAKPLPSDVSNPTTKSNANEAPSKPKEGLKSEDSLRTNQGQPGAPSRGQPPQQAPKPAGTQLGRKASSTTSRLPLPVSESMTKLTDNAQTAKPASKNQSENVQTKLHLHMPENIRKSTDSLRDSKNPLQSQPENIRQSVDSLQVLKKSPTTRLEQGPKNPPTTNGENVKESNYQNKPPTTQRNGSSLPKSATSQPPPPRDVRKSSETLQTPKTAQQLLVGPKGVKASTDSLLGVGRKDGVLAGSERDEVAKPDTTRSEDKELDSAKQVASSTTAGTKSPSNPTSPTHTANSSSLPKQDGTDIPPPGTGSNTSGAEAPPQTSIIKSDSVGSLKKKSPHGAASVLKDPTRKPEEVPPPPNIIDPAPASALKHGDLSFSRPPPPRRKAVQKSAQGLFSAAAVSATEALSEAEASPDASHDMVKQKEDVKKSGKQESMNATGPSATSITPISKPVKEADRSQTNIPDEFPVESAESRNADVTFAKIVGGEQRIEEVSSTPPSKKDTSNKERMSRDVVANASGKTLIDEHGFSKPNDTGVRRRIPSKSVEKKQAASPPDHPSQTYEERTESSSGRGEEDNNATSMQQSGAPTTAKIKTEKKGSGTPNSMKKKGNGQSPFNKPIKVRSRKRSMTGDPTATGGKDIETAGGEASTNTPTYSKTSRAKTRRVAEEKPGAQPRKREETSEKLKVAASRAPSKEAKPRTARDTKAQEVSSPQQRTRRGTANSDVGLEDQNISSSSMRKPSAVHITNSASSASGSRLFKGPTDQSESPDTKSDRRRSKTSGSDITKPQRPYQRPSKSQASAVADFHPSTNLTGRSTTLESSPARKSTGVKSGGRNKSMSQIPKEAQSRTAPRSRVPSSSRNSSRDSTGPPGSPLKQDSDNSGQIKFGARSRRPTNSRNPSSIQSPSDKSLPVSSSSASRTSSKNDKKPVTKDVRGSGGGKIRDPKSRSLSRTRTATRTPADESSSESAGPSRKARPGGKETETTKSNRSHRPSERPSGVSEAHTATERGLPQMAKQLSTVSEGLEDSSSSEESVAYQQGTVKPSTSLGSGSAELGNKKRDSMINESDTTDSMDSTAENDGTLIVPGKSDGRIPKKSQAASFKSSRVLARSSTLSTDSEEGTSDKREDHVPQTALQKNAISQDNLSNATLVLDSDFGAKRRTTVSVKTPEKETDFIKGGHFVDRSDTRISNSNANESNVAAVDGDQVSTSSAGKPNTAGADVDSDFRAVDTQKTSATDKLSDVPPINGQPKIQKARQDLDEAVRKIQKAWRRKHQSFSDSDNSMPRDGVRTRGYRRSANFDQAARKIQKAWRRTHHTSSDSDSSTTKGGWETRERKLSAKLDKGAMMDRNDLPPTNESGQDDANVSKSKTITVTNAKEGRSLDLQKDLMGLNNDVSVTTDSEQSDVGVRKSPNLGGSEASLKEKKRDANISDAASTDSLKMVKSVRFSNPESQIAEISASDYSTSSTDIGFSANESSDEERQVTGKRSIQTTDTPNQTERHQGTGFGLLLNVDSPKEDSKAPPSEKQASPGQKVPIAKQAVGTRLSEAKEDAAHPTDESRISPYLKTSKRRPENEEESMSSSSTKRTQDLPSVSDKSENENLRPVVSATKQALTEGGRGMVALARVKDGKNHATVASVAARPGRIIINFRSSKIPRSRVVISCFSEGRRTILNEESPVQVEAKYAARWKSDRAKEFGGIQSSQQIRPFSTATMPKSDAEKHS